MHRDFQLYNPFRDPQWRYERCLKLVENRPHPLPASPRRDDQAVRDYRKFLLKYLRTEDEDQRLALFPKNPELFYAHLIHHHPDREWRTIVQARILAGCADEEIADLSGVLPGAVDLYEQLFFNVRDRLTCRDYIVKTVIGTAAQRAANRYDTETEHQREMLYKLFGYFGGPLILDVIISGFVPGDMPRDAKQIATWFDRTMKQLIKRKSTMEARRFECDKFKIMELMHVHCQIMSTEKGQGGGPESDIEKAVAELLNQVPWGLAKKGYNSLTPTQQQYALTHVEPRADEQLLLAAGEVPSTLIEQEQRVDKKLLELNLRED